MEVIVRRLITLFFICMLVICGILIAGTAFLHFVDLDPYRKHIASLATKATGRQVEINGHIEINVFPHPEVILNDVSLANAKWGTEPAMASVGHVDAAISFPSLFSDTIIVRRLRLQDVTMLLETNDQQVGNWVMGTTTPSAGIQKEKTNQDPDKIVDLPLMVDLAEFHNITATVRAPGRTDQVYRLSSFSLQPDESGDLILKSSGEISGSPVVLDGRITSKESLFAHGAVKVDLQAALGDAELIGQVSTSRLATLADLHGTFSITVQDIHKALGKAKIEAPLTGPLTADATVRIDGSVYKAAIEARVEGITATVDGSYTDKQVELNSTLTPLRRAGELVDLQGLSADAMVLKARVAKSGANDFEIKQFQADVGRNRLTAQGRINKDGDATVSLTLASPDLSTLFDTLPTIDFSAKASTRYSAGKIAVPDLLVTFGKSDIKGNFTMVRGDKQAVTAKLTSALLDLRPFSETAEPDDRAKKAAAKARPETKTDAENRYVFKKAPLQLEPLENVEADVTLSVNHLYYDAFELKDAAVNAAAHNGRVDARFKCDSANDGHAAGKIALETRDGKALVDTLVSLSDFRMNAFLTGGISPVDVPPISVSLELKTTGSSPRELASAANGRVLLTQGSGKIHNNMMGMFSSDIVDQLVSALNPFARDEKFSNWDCTVVSVNIVNGLADIDGMLAQGEKVMIVGDGDVDLKTEKLNVEFNTKPRSGVGISADMFVTPFIKVKGTLASPGIGLNKKGTFLTGGAAVATGGLSVLVKGVLDRSTAEGDHCEKALGKAGEHTRFAF